MAYSTRSKNEHILGFGKGAIFGFGVGVAFTLESWIAAGVIKLLLCWDTGIWPDWFPGYIPDFILSRWWLIIVTVIFTAAGALVGSRGNRFELF